MRIKELQFSLEQIPDGVGGETRGLVTRVWMDKGDGDNALVHELRSRLEDPHDAEGAREWAVAWLDTMAAF